MSRDKFKTYVFQILLVLILILALFEPNIISNSVVAFILLIYMLIVNFGLKKRKILSIYSRQIIFLMIGFAIIYLGIFYLSGLYFGYYKAPIPFGLWGISHYIIPFIVIIISSEIIRYVFLSQKNKFSNIFAFISMVLVDIILYTKVYDIGYLEDFLAVIGFVTFASVSCNLFYNYVSSRFGYKSIICYRLITVLYAYVIPIIPDVYIFFRSIGRMIYPYLMYLLVENTYSKTNLASEYKSRKQRIINTTVLIVVICLIAMLISCKFRYGILVIGSGSMTGTINKGDAVVFEDYHNQKLREGNIIIFESNNMMVVHRIVDVKIVNGKYRYYTKGDANQELDVGFITDSEIVGISKFRIPCIGYPTIWLREMKN